MNNLNDSISTNTRLNFSNSTRNPFIQKIKVDGYSAREAAFLSGFSCCNAIKIYKNCFLSGKFEKKKTGFLRLKNIIKLENFFNNRK